MGRNGTLKSKKHNYVYKITNLINQKYYYGIHSTDNLDDDYFGSGSAIKQAIKEFGIKNFQKEIIANYPSRKQASDHERLIVNEQLVNANECYNLKLGGDVANNLIRRMSDSVLGDQVITMIQNIF